MEQRGVSVMGMIQETAWPFSYPIPIREIAEGDRVFVWDFGTYPGAEKTLVAQGPLDSEMLTIKTEYGIHSYHLSCLLRAERDYKPGDWIIT